MSKADTLLKNVPKVSPADKLRQQIADAPKDSINIEKQSEEPSEKPKKSQQDENTLPPVKPKPQGPLKRVSIDLTPELHMRVKTFCMHQGVPIGDHLKSVIEWYMDRVEEDEK